MRWQLSRLSTAPHRLGFGAGCLTVGIASAWWLAVIVARAIGLTVPWAVPPAVAHATTLVYGFMPLFMVGFIFTAGPRWLHLPDATAPPLVPDVAAMTAGTLLALIGWHLHPVIAVVGVLIAALGWGRLMLRWGRLVAASPFRDRMHPKIVLVAGVVILAAMLVDAGAIALGHFPLARAAVLAGLWGGITAVFVAVSHRMLPFFTAGVLPQWVPWRPPAVMGAMLALVGLEALLAVAQALDATWPQSPAVRAGVVCIEAIGGVGLLGLALRWGLVHSLKNRLLAMLHLSFVWLGIAFVLQALAHALAWFGSGSMSLGLAPMHALTIGYLGGTWMAMATRVAAGHSGRALAADDFVWRLYLLVHAAAVLRVVADVATAEGAAAPWWLVAAAAAWAAAAVAWAFRYASWMGRPRVDGRPG